MTFERECFVYVVLPGETRFVTAGRFWVSKNRDGVDIGRFVYRRQYLDSANAVELDPVELQFRTETFETPLMEGFFGAIRDAIPDYWGRLVIERNAGVALLDNFTYLLKGPDDRAGALGFGTNVEPPSPRYKFNRTLDLERLQATADAIVNDEPSLAGSAEKQVKELLMLSTSMGGARPKAVVEDGGSLWLAKFSRQDDRYNQPRVEHAMLRLARACSLNAASSRLTSIADRDVLLVRRFDRDAAEDGYQRHRMVSALTLLRSDTDLANRSKWSYLLLADEIRRVSTRPEADLRELFARMCFNAVVSNIDDHPRNHALLARNDGWRLSPAYDLMPFSSASRDRRDLAMICGQYGRHASRRNLLSAHGRFLLSADDASRILESVVDIVRAEWRPMLRRAGVTERDSQILANAFLYPGFDY